MASVVPKLRRVGPGGFAVPGGYRPVEVLVVQMREEDLSALEVRLDWGVDDPMASLLSKTE